MRNILYITLALVLLLGLTACGKTEAPENPYEKYEKLFRYMEDEDYDAAIEYIRKKAEKNKTSTPADIPMEAPAATEALVAPPAPMPPAEAAPQWESVEITMENWQDYFEFREYPEFIKNGFGEFEEFKLWFVLTSKDGIIPDCDQSNVTFEYSLRSRYYPISLDPETEGVTFGAPGGYDPYRKWENVETMNGMGQYIGEYHNSRYGEYLGVSGTQELVYNQFNRDEFEILRIAGTFVFQRAS